MLNPQTKRSGSSRPHNGLDLGEVPNQEVFQRRISLELKRSGRTLRPCVLLLMDTRPSQRGIKSYHTLLDVFSALRSTTRETDIIGWHETNSVLGILFTDITLETNRVLSIILTRISNALRDQLTHEQLCEIKFSFHPSPVECGRYGFTPDTGVRLPLSDMPGGVSTWLAAKLIAG